MHVRIHGTALPPLDGSAPPLLAGLQHGRDVPAPQRVTPAAVSLTFDAALDVVVTPRGVDFRGPWVHGRPGDRFLYLSWGHDLDGEFDMFRRAKLMLGVLDPADMVAAGEDALLTGTLSLIDPRGGPICAAVRPPTIRWELRTGDRS